MRTIRTKVYQFSELSEPAKQKALMNYAKYCSEFMDIESVFMKSAKKMDRMKTPWFLAETIYHEQRQEMIEEITINEYEFKNDGTRF